MAQRHHTAVVMAWLCFSSPSVLWAAAAGEWDCVPAADGRGWDCRKDGVPAPKAAPRAAEPRPEDGGARIKPLDAPALPPPQPLEPARRELPPAPPPPAAREPQPPRPTPATEPRAAPPGLPAPAEPPAPPPATPGLTAPQTQSRSDLESRIEISREPPPPAVAPAPVPPAETPAAGPEPAVASPPPEPADTSSPLATPAPAPAPAAAPEPPPPAPEPAPATAASPPPPAPAPSFAATAAEADAARAAATRPAALPPDGHLAYCASRPTPPPKKSLAPGFVPRAQAEMKIEADALDAPKDGETVLRGNVDIRRADQEVQADEVRVQRDAKVLEASGNVRYRDDDISATASRVLQEDLAQRETYYEAQYQQHQPYHRGAADKIVREGGVRTTLENARYSTCPPEEESWRLEAENVVLDQDTGRGEARAATLYFQDTPIFYTPYFNFPIDDRRLSGVLTPKFSNNSVNGAEVTVPYYFNLAENYDATLTPRLLSKRGLMLGGEFRYLLPGESAATPRHEGKMNLEALPSDRAYLDLDRWHYLLAHRGQAPGGVNYDLQLNRVSDRDYLDTLGNTLGATSTSFLDSHLAFNKSWEYAALSGQVQRYQTVTKNITPVQEPYQREPQVALSAWTPTLPGGVVARLDSEYARFHHNANVTGERLDLYPSVSLPVRHAAWFFTPKAGLRHTSYDLANTAPGAPTSPARTLPVFSLDGGLFFERDTAFGGTALTQTLEPRLYYLNIPHKDQTALPVFDTGLQEFGSTVLFRENQFTGADRVNDANQLSAGVTSRFLDAGSGDELLSLTAGQIYYFKNRRVVLPGAALRTADSSAMVLEGAWRPSRAWAASAAFVWDPDTNDTEKGVLSLRYQPERHKILNGSYRYRRGNLDQTDLSFLWPLNPQWRLAGRWNYDLASRESLDTFAGLEYESCCFITRVLARSFVNQSGAQRNDAIYLELELKGLGSIGNRVEHIFEEDILGYEPRTE